MATVQSTPGVQFNLKLAAGVKHRKLNQMLADAPGIESVIQTFPDEADDELSRLYVLEVSAAQADAAMNLLRHRPEVEYVEPTASRRPMRKR